MALIPNSMLYRGILVGLLLITCSKSNRINEGVAVIGLKPGNAILGSYSVRVEVHPLDTGWEVSVVFTLPAGKAPLRSEAVSLEMHATDGSKIKILGAPQGYLPAFGNSRGTSVNAKYLFSKHPEPARLVVRYESKEAIFKLVPYFPAPRQAVEKSP